jgi:hypothetical protein
MPMAAITPPKIAFQLREGKVPSKRLLRPVLLVGMGADGLLIREVVTGSDGSWYIDLLFGWFSYFMPLKIAQSYFQLNQCQTYFQLILR